MMLRFEIYTSPNKPSEIIIESPGVLLTAEHVTEICTWCESLIVDGAKICYWVAWLGADAVAYGSMHDYGSHVEFWMSPWGEAAGCYRRSYKLGGVVREER